MQTLTFSTGNKEKFDIAHAACTAQAIELLQANLDIPEIQSENSEDVIKDKADKAFTALQRPVIVSDDAWNIPGLNGFPGPYMKSIDHWFSTQDFLNLTCSLEDRRIILVQLLAYQDVSVQKIFKIEYVGELLSDARGTYGKPLQKVISMPGDKGLSVAEAYDQGSAGRDRKVSKGWDEFLLWYRQYSA